MKKKYFTLIFGFIVSLLVYAVIYLLALISGPGSGMPPLIPGEYVKDFVWVLPGPLWTDIIFLYIFPVITFLIFVGVAPYSTTFFLKLHRIIFRAKKRNIQYGKLELGLKIKGLHIFRRSLVASLFAFSITALIVQAGFGGLFRSGMMQDSILNEAEAVFLGTFFIIPFVLLIFFPIWMLEDSGVVIYRKYSDFRKPPYIEGSHTPFQSILEGYAGISTLIILVTYIFGSIQEVGISDPAILTPIILIVLPFLLTGLFAIPVLIYERILAKTLTRVNRSLSKLDIAIISIPPFEDMVKG
ncbi:MAG: hypothetical protein ACW98D_05015 [Promethearchaeota archaeon]|jgi:hypothetical protein